MAAFEAALPAIDDANTKRIKGAGAKGSERAKQNEEPTIRRL